MFTPVRMSAMSCWRSKLSCLRFNNSAGTPSVMAAFVSLNMSSSERARDCSLTLNDSPAYSSDFPLSGAPADGFSSNAIAARSEEHTSELQSRLHLVCRLLLEKKKTLQHTTTHYSTCYASIYTNHDISLPR